MLLKVNDVPENEIVEIGRKDVGPDEEVIGVVGLQTRKLYTLLSRHTNATSAKIRELSPGARSFKDMDAANKIIEPLMKTAELLKEIFWQEVCDELGAHGKEIGIRKGWKVIALPPETEESALTLKDELEMIFGTAAQASPDCGNPNCPVHGRAAQVQSLPS